MNSDTGTLNLYLIYDITCKRPKLDLERSGSMWFVLFTLLKESEFEFGPLLLAARPRPFCEG